MGEESKKTLVLGANDSPYRYAYVATDRLKKYGHEVIPLGNRPGNIEGIEIETEPGDYENVHTITMYLNPYNQREYYDYILSLKPRRLIFNPGSENPELMRLATEAGIEVVQACTLVMLSTGQY